MRQDVLLEFNGSIPRFALFQGWEIQPLEKHCDILASPRHDPTQRILVAPQSGMESQPNDAGFLPLEAKVTKIAATVRVKASHPSILRFSQFNKGDWTVFVDGVSAKVLDVDYVLLGVLVPAGEHTVEFRCPQAKNRVCFTVIIFFLSIFLSVILILFPKKGLK